VLKSPSGQKAPLTIDLKVINLPTLPQKTEAGNATPQHNQQMPAHHALFFCLSISVPEIRFGNIIMEGWHGPPQGGPLLLGR